MPNRTMWDGRESERMGMNDERNSENMEDKIEENIEDKMNEMIDEKIRAELIRTAAVSYTHLRAHET